MKERHFGLTKFIPKRLIKYLDPIYFLFFKPEKYEHELNFWKNRYEEDNHLFDNSNYEKLMLGMAGENNENFLKNKIVADFGCGPRGSLKWLKSATIKIGTDVLVDKYVDIFYSNIISHEMIYLKCTESAIPIPSDYIDILFTLNAIDHVDSFEKMSKEIVRIIKPGGEFIGSFNLNEPATTCEPESLSEEIVKKELLSYFTIKSYRISGFSGNNRYEPFIKGKLHYEKGEIATLWVRAVKN